jgi:hypothetical protein
MPGEQPYLSREEFAAAAAVTLSSDASIHWPDLFLTCP